MLKNMRLSAKLYLVMSILILTAILISSAGIYSLSRINAMLDYQNNTTIPQIMAAETLKSDILNVVRFEKNSVIAATGAFQKFIYPQVFFPVYLTSWFFRRHIPEGARYYTRVYSGFEPPFCAANRLERALFCIFLLFFILYGVDQS